MPTVTNRFAASSAGGASQSIVVNQGETVVVSLSRADGTAHTTAIQCRVQRQVNGSNWQSVPDSAHVPGYLTSDAGEIVLSAPGTYRVIVPATPYNVVVEEHR
ncbi:hypothetical protein LPQ06_28465 [Klebsiella pneumoniae]|nr:hypothetical protein [Klebsiella pneumoniae]